MYQYIGLVNRSCKGKLLDHRYRNKYYCNLYIGQSSYHLMHDLIYTA